MNPFYDEGRGRYYTLFEVQKFSEESQTHRFEEATRFTSGTLFSVLSLTLIWEFVHRAASLPKDYCGDCVQMRLSYSPLAPLFLRLIEWMDYTCMDAVPNFLGLLHILVYKVYIDGMPTISSQEKNATVREFYAVIYPSLIQLEGDFLELEKRNLKNGNFEDLHRELDDECGICMEHCTKMVLPNCGHSMCISCFHDWNSRCESCPFCRGSLKRVSSKDLWVLTSKFDVADPKTLARENVGRFYLYMDSLPLVTLDTNSLLFDYMI